MFQIMCMDDGSNKLQLSYMVQKKIKGRSYYMWPRERDVSWEDASVVVKRLEPPTINEKSINNRLLYYKFCV